MSSLVDIPNALVSGVLTIDIFDGLQPGHNVFGDS